MVMPWCSWKALWQKAPSTEMPTSFAPALLELREDLLVDAQLVGADRAEVGRVEDEHDASRRVKSESETRLPS